MKNNKYQNAVSHLKFSDDLYQRVMENAPEPKRPTRMLAILATAVLAMVLLVSTVMAVGFHFQNEPIKIEHTVPVETLGTVKEEITQAKMLELTISQMTEGVTVHYMELDPVIQYSYFHGMFHGWSSGYQRITEDYTFEQIEMQTADIYFDKNGRTYKTRIVYLDTEYGVVTKAKNIYQKNINGEILVDLYCPQGGHWAVYFNVETGAYRDALPQWTEDDFEGNVSTVEALKGGLMVTTLVDAEPNGYNVHYWIGSGYKEPRKLDIPREGVETIFNDTLYYQNPKGHLYIMDDNFELQLYAEYETNDMLTNGLLTVETEDGKVGVLDALTNELYVFPDIDASEVEIDEVSGMHAVRYGTDGRIALVLSQVDWDELRLELVQIGVLDLERGELRMLQIPYDLQVFGAHWLDENRLGVIYKSEDRQFFCIYEFE